MNAEDYIRSKIRRILSEGEQTPVPKPEQKQKEKPRQKKKKSSGKVIAKYGKGRHSAAVAGSKARVESDPSGLLGDLGAEVPDADSDIQKILGLVRSAIYGTDVMAAAYVGAHLITRQDGGKQINVSVKALKPRDGVYFMEHVLVAAQNTGQLTNLSQNVTLAVGGGGLAISFG